MRKRLLRSRSGFEKPESREEAIMQNILGASNVLEPSESNIEEILKSILYNTPYTKDAEFEIEKILLAIKNNGTYDGECESRDMKILFAILKDLDYTEEAESRIEELLIEWLHQRSSIKVLEGVPPLTFTSRGLPLINYLIEGNTIQNGTPTPDSPIMPQGTGERAENLFDKNTAVFGKYVNDDGTVTQESIDKTAWLTDYIPVTAGLTYTLNQTGSRRGKFYKADKTPYQTESMDFSGLNNKNTFTIPETVAYIRFSIYIGVTTPNVIMLNLGSEALPYEPYGIKIPISSANTTTPIYLGEVETTRRIKKLVLTGEETVQTVSGNAPYRISVPGLKIPTLVQVLWMCSHYRAVPSTASWSQYNSLISWNGGDGATLRFRDTSKADVNAFKAFLSSEYSNGTPVTIWYVLATPETGTVNETLMKIGDYADTLSMEQAGVQIPTNNGTTVIDVDTTVKPSNVYIEYK